MVPGAEDFDSSKPSRCSGTTITSGLSQLVLDPWEDNYPTEPSGNTWRKMGYAPAYDTAYATALPHPEWTLCGLDVKIGKYGSADLNIKTANNNA